MLEVSSQAVSKWEREDCYPDISLLPVIADTIGCKVDDFFEIISQTPNLSTQNCVHLLEHGGDNKNE